LEMSDALFEEEADRTIDLLVHGLISRKEEHQ